MTTCKIQWIDEKGNPTPDNNPAVGEVRLREHLNRYGKATGDNNCWYPICQAHLDRFYAMRETDPIGMEHWEYKPNA